MMTFSDLLVDKHNRFVFTTIAYLQGIPVNRKVIYMMEGVQKLRKFRLVHGGLLESEDIFGRRMGTLCFITSF